MIEKRLLKWSIIVPFALLGLALLSIVLYVLVPIIISALTGIEVDADCGYPGVLVPADVPPIQESVMGLCNASHSFLATVSMLLIIFSGLLSLIPMALVSFDIFGSEKMSGLRKVLWLAAMWMLFGLFAAAAYYFMERKD